jgi:5-carboxymethyl-2-hydroxymuconate isomerase
MPHIRIDYSSNLSDIVNPADLVSALHRAAIDTGIFPTTGIRTYAQPLDFYQVADGDSSIGFVRITVRIAPGRDLEKRRHIGRALFDAASGMLDIGFKSRKLTFQLEVEEFDDTLTFKRTNLE